MKYSIFCSITLSVILASSQVHSVERTFVMLGGGGEPEKISSTIFDPTLNYLDSYLQKNKWRNVISFNGGHSQTEAIMAMKFSDSINKSSFTKNNYEVIIKNYEQQIKSGQMKAGDQLMLMIDTHGAMKSDNDSTHQIAVGSSVSQLDRNSLSGSGSINVSLDALKNLTALAREKGIKLAIIDFSCHSGNSLSLANENTCVISSTGTNHFGYNTFSENFINKMKPGRSLEDVFLDTRKGTTDNSYPMISSPEGVAINKEIYPSLTPYLYYYEVDPNLDKMTNYLLEASSNGGLCTRQNQYDDLQKQLESLRAASVLNMNKNIPEIKKIKNLIDQYKEKQDRYINLVRSWGVAELSRKELFNGSSTVGRKTATMDGNFTWKQMMETDYDSIIRNVTIAKKNAKDPYTQAQFQASIEMHTKARDKKNEILSQYPNLNEYKQKFKDQLNEMKGTYAIANQIALEERKLYDSMYSNLKIDKKQSSACKDFVL